MDLNQLINQVLTEATSDGGGRGSYVAPLQPGVRLFKKKDMQPFTEPVSKYDSPMLEFDSYDGSMDETKKQIKKIESKAKKVSNYIKKHPNSTFSDDDGNNINQTPGKKLKIVPVNEWVEITDNTLMEDLGVWFGTKKKPKGSKQPKGPWVNICKKVDGKHPPCGRHDATDKAYPKCRAAGVAGKMSDSEKRNACQQKRRAEKKDTQTGKGQKPIMTSYKPKKNIKEDMGKVIKLTENDLINLVKQIIKENNDGPLNISNGQSITLKCNHISGKYSPITISGNIEITSRNAAWGYRDPNTDQYIEPDKVIPEFFVTKQEKFGVLAGQSISESIYIEPITEDLKNELGVTSGNVLTYFDGGSIGNPNKRYYCEVINVTDQFKNELVSNDVKVN